MNSKLLEIVLSKPQGFRPTKLMKLLNSKIEYNCNIKAVILPEIALDKVLTIGKVNYQKRKEVISENVLTPDKSFPIYFENSGVSLENFDDTIKKILELPWFKISGDFRLLNDTFLDELISNHGFSKRLEQL